ncbi:MAG: LysE family transporter [Xanthomonadaceae bacterium]|nr:LysE family transporter [Xanthomonadaceae bacterium]
MNTQAIINIFAQGFFLQASLILALGAQNIFVLNSGLRKQRHLLVALVSSICDTLLVFVGVLGVATFFVQFPILKISLGVIGVGFLAYYGILKLKEVMNGIEFSQTSQVSTTIKQTILTSLGFSLLNPHVYLDTVVLIGGYSSKFSLFIERFYFGAGASTFSTIWFFGLALLASLASRILNNPKTMRIVSLLSSLILVLLAIKLGTDVFEWIKFAYS